MFIDLFSGCGGLSLGARLAGLKEEVAIDCDVNLTSSFNQNFPKAKLLNADLAKLEPKDLKTKFSIKRPDAVIGGPPCQGFSVMGRRDIADSRNKLLERYFAYVKYFRPKFFLMENVPGLYDSANRATLERALELVPGTYNVIRPMILDAADFGAATSRPRLVVIGYDPKSVDKFDEATISAAEIQGRIDVKAALSDLPSLDKETTNGEWLAYRPRRKASNYAASLRKNPPRGLGTTVAREMLKKKMVSGCQSTIHSKAVIKRFAELAPGERDPISKYPRLSWNKQAFVLRAGTGSDRGSYQAARPIHPDEPRVITVREAARIQGFPDWFQFHPTKWHSHRMIGNSVSPQFARAILRVAVSRMK